MTIRANLLKPTPKVEDLDVYLPRGTRALEEEGKNPRGLWRIFQRHDGARFFGAKEYLSALASVVGAEAAKDTIVYAAPEGQGLKKHETAVTLEGPAQSLIANETLLHFLSTGTRFRTLAADYPVSQYPWVFMGARYLSSEDLAIATRALAEEGILSTVPKWADKYIGTMSHSQIAMWGAVRLEYEIEKIIASETADVKVAATIRATVAFARANPEVPLYVLGDFAARSVGCFETFRATAAVCKKLGLNLLGGRMDISKADLDNKLILDASVAEDYESELTCKVEEIIADAEDDFRRGSYLKGLAIEEMNSKYQGMSLEIVKKVRKLLDESSLEAFKIVVSSGIKLKEIEAYKEAGADIVGIGEEAAYYLDKGQCNFTSDAVGYFDESGALVPFAKDGRELERVVSTEVLAEAKSGVRISPHLVQHKLEDYL